MGNCIWDYVGLYGKLYFSRWQCPPPFHTTLYRFSLNRILHYRKPINCVVYLVLLSTKCIFIGLMCTWGPIIGSPCLSVTTSKSFLKLCEDQVKTVNVVNVDPS